MKPILAVIATLLLIHSVQGYSISAWYSCDRQRCLRPNCQCASDTSPLDINDTPQFIVISNDDQVAPTAVEPMARLVSSSKNKNGCPIPVTWFTRSEFSACQTVRERYEMGDEFASHAVKHIKLLPSTPTADIIREVTGARTYLYKCGLPEGSVKGYRAAYRTSSPRIRQIVKDEGFLYDSTIGFELAEMNERPFPFTLNNAIPDPSCTTCTTEESYSSLWQVPIWALQYNGNVYPMDPGMSRKKKGKSLNYKGEVFPIDFVAEAEQRASLRSGNRTQSEIDRAKVSSMDANEVLTYAFNSAYNGNRAPVPIAVHPYWFSETRLHEAQMFIDYALSHDNVYFVTFSQLVEWMQNPVPVGEMDSWLKARCENKPLKKKG